MELKNKIGVKMKTSLLFLFILLSSVAFATTGVYDHYDFNSYNITEVSRIESDNYCNDTFCYTLTQLAASAGSSTDTWVKVNATTITNYSKILTIKVSYLDSLWARISNVNTWISSNISVENTTMTDYVDSQIHEADTDTWVKVNSTTITNYSKILTIKVSYIDSIWARISNLVGYLGNFSREKSQYATVDNTTTWINANYTELNNDIESMPNLTLDEIQENIGNYSKDRPNVAFKNESNVFIDGTTQIMQFLNVSDTIYLDGARLSNRSDNGLWNGMLQVNGQAEPNNNLIFIVEGNGTSGVIMPHFWIQNGAASQASGISRSFMIVNEGVQLQNTTNITSCPAYMEWANETLKIDCNTTTTGADLLVGDDMQVVGDVWIKDTDGEWHFMTRSLKLQDEIFDNLFLSRSNLSLDGTDFNILQHTGDYLIVNVNEIETIKTVNNETVTVINGTNSSPVLNMITYDDTFTLQRTASLPSGEYANVARFMYGAPGNVYAGLGGRSSTSNFVAHSYIRLFKTGILYESGFLPTLDATNISIGGGSMTLLLDSHTYTNILDLINDGAFLVQSNGTYVQFNAISDIQYYADGGAIGTNKYYNLVCGIMHNDISDSRLFCVVANEPATEYISVLTAEADKYSSVNIFPGNAFLKNLFIPVARMIIKHDTDEFETLSSGTRYLDVRGATSAAGAPAAAGVTDHGLLEGLDDDDHSAIYYSQTIIDSINTSDNIVSLANGSSMTVQCSKINFSGTIGATNICDGDDAAGGGSGASKWVDNGTYLYANSTYAENIRIYGTLRITELASCDTINTTPDGDLICGTDETGAGSDTDTWYNINFSTLNNDSKILTVNETWIDTIWARISNLVSLVGNWSREKSLYATIDNTTTWINANYTELKNDVNSLPNLTLGDITINIANWSYEKSQYATVDNTTEWVNDNVTRLDSNDAQINTTANIIALIGVHSNVTDSNASTACDGSTTYLDGDGNCDTLDTLGDFTNDINLIANETNAKLTYINMSHQNITSVDCILFTSGGDICG